VNSVNNQLYSYLVMTAGDHCGRYILLEGDDDIQIGRGLDCEIVLNDPLSSRVHAIVYRRDQQWRLRDADSRNGTFVDGNQIDDVVLQHDSSFRLGGSEFQFQQSATLPSDAGLGPQTVLSQTLVRDVAVSSAGGSDNLLPGTWSTERVEDLLNLYQLSIRLWEVDDPDDVVRIALELLHDQTESSITGFLWVHDDGQLKPKIVIPSDAVETVGLSESLTDMVCRQGRAVWINNETGFDEAASLREFADGLCVPLIYQQKTLGAVHLYRSTGHFRDQDFEMVLAISRLLSVALARTRQQTRLQVDHQRLVAKTADGNELIGDSVPMQELKNRMEKIGQATGCVLIRGESGAGKELVARGVHRCSARMDRPMLAVNCAAIAPDLMESQLFGHRKGAFTGAEHDHQGWFRQADSGTLFLDEVGELTLEGQAKLLRILEGHSFQPVGSTEEVTVDVRVIAATNQDLNDYVRSGKFREDLYYRLSVFELYIPPLRDRDEDVELLVDFFLAHFKEQHGRPDLQFSDEARHCLLNYHWPGNVRQLRNVIDSSVVLADSDLIQRADLGLRDAGQPVQDDEPDLTSLNIETWEQKLIQRALERTSGNVPEASKLLGIGRATLYRKIEHYGIER
jgi:two-component system response regulator HydG